MGKILSDMIELFSHNLWTVYLGPWIQNIRTMTTEKLGQFPNVGMCTCVDKQEAVCKREEAVCEKKETVCEMQEGMCERGSSV